MFRAMIYDDSAYEGVRFLADPNEYTYFPDFWDSTFYASEVDLVGSTRANPAVYESFLIEPTIHFGNSEASMEDIESVEALNVPSSVVTITKNASDGSFDVVFHSNFYVAVEFKITTTNETYYMTIQRTTLQVRDTNGEESTPHIVAKFYYTADDTYADYDIVATIYYTDGTKEIKILEPTSTDNDGGSNLKYATYSIEQNGVKGVAYTAVKAGALSGSTFGGVKAGAEEGYYFDCNSRKIVY